MENKDLIPEIPINPSETRKMQENPKLKAYVEWALSNGVIFDKVSILLVSSAIVDTISCNIWAGFDGLRCEGGHSKQ